MPTLPAPTAPQIPTHKRISSLKFGVFAPSDIQKLAELQCTTHLLHETTTPTTVPHGLLDARMGVSEKMAICETCGMTLQDCAGHFGYIQLALPVFHVGYLTTVIKILQQVCKTCSRVLLSDKLRRKQIANLRDPNLDNIKRMRILKENYNECRKVLICPSCRAPNAHVKKFGAFKVVHEQYKQKSVQMQESREVFLQAAKDAPEITGFVNKMGEDLTPLRVTQIFNQMSMEDIELVGLDSENSHPSHYLWHSIPVPPVCIRPSINSERDGTTENDATTKLCEVIGYNTLLQNKLAQGDAINQVMTYWELLQTSAALYINSEINLHQKMEKAPGKGFVQRLKGKQGRFRGNLSGKRVDFSGRTVISPDPNLEIDQVAVPERVAKILTYPDRVTDHNIRSLRKAVRNGADVHPGANYVTLQATGQKYRLKYANCDQFADKLAVGDVVERHMADEDIVLFNRQPSLHKLSIMSHRAKIRPWRTFRFNECVCTPYNADFDGDEMNMHLPQTEEAKAEARELMGVKMNICTPRNGQPLIAATQDFITGCYLITRRDVLLNKADFMQCISFFSNARVQIDIPPPAILKPCALWTGKQLFSLLIKPSRASKVLINLEAKTKSFSGVKELKGLPKDMCPRDGWLVIRNSQIMCGVMDKSIIGGENKDNLFYVILRDFGRHEAAISMGRVAKLCARFLANRGFSIGIDDVQPRGQLTSKKAEIISGADDECNEQIQKYADNTIVCQPGCNQEQTLEAEISGKLSQIREQLGNICLEELNKLNSPLVMTTCGSKGSKINVCQMVACVGQQIISGNRIADGFVNRTLPHFQTGSKAPNAKGFVANSFYSGLTPTEFFFHAASGREGLVDTAVKTAETGYMQRRLVKALEDLTTHYDTSVRNSAGQMIQFTYGDDGLDPTNIESNDGAPVDLARVWRHSCAAIPTIPLSQRNRGDEQLTPEQMRHIFKVLLQGSRWKRDCHKWWLKQFHAWFKQDVLAVADHYTSVHSMLDAEEALDVMSKIWPSTRNQIKLFTDMCYAKYLSAKIEPATACGALGAQSIGEPGTQMTLKTFHFAGVASMNVTMGVPRIKEIINASKVISTPIITTCLASPNSETVARIIKGRLEITTLGSISKYMEEVYRPYECYIGFRIDLKTIELLQLEIDLDTITRAIAKKAGTRQIKVNIEQIKISGSDYIKVLAVPGKLNSDVYYQMQLLKRQLPKVVVKGISTVERAVISAEKSTKDLPYFELLVEGVGLQEVMTTEGVVGRNTTSNHIMEVEKVLGIEAARSTIISQIQDVMKKHGMTIDPRHTMLLADVMTYKGDVFGITRFGISKMRDSVLMLASFEKTTDHLFDASLYGKKDAIEGVSECIIMGAPMPIGTGLFKCMYNTEAMKIAPKSGWTEGQRPVITEGPKKRKDNSGYELENDSQRFNVRLDAAKELVFEELFA